MMRFFECSLPSKYNAGGNYVKYWESRKIADGTSVYESDTALASSA
jgi:hypothetical protein